MKNSPPVKGELEGVFKSRRPEVITQGSVASIETNGLIPEQVRNDKSIFKDLTTNVYAFFFSV